MSEKKAKGKMPAIRFKGFGLVWKEVLLSHVTDIYDGTHQTPRYINEGVMFLSVENIQSLTSEKFISKEDFEKDFKVYPMKNDVLMTRIGDVGTANVVTTNNPIAYYVTLALLKYKGVNPYFLKNSLSSDSVKKEIWHRTLHIAFPKKINMNEIAKVVLNVPKNQKEQTKIGKLFQQLDTLINQHQQKHEKLRCVKKALLTKMFPKQGETQPAIRFKGFSAAWEEKALGDVAPDISDGDWIESDHIFNSGKYRIIQTGNLGLGDFIDKPSHAKYFHQKDFDEIKANEIYPDDLLISRLAEPAGRTIELPNTKFRMVTAVDVTVIRPSDKFNSTFLKTQLNSPSVLKVINESVSGTSHKRISRANLEKVNFDITSIEEQTKIGKLFQQLDTLINQHQTKINKLNQIKQAMLAKMFV